MSDKPFTEADLIRTMILGPGEAMRQNERELGHRIILPGDEPWLPKGDWPDNVVVTQARNRIRIIAIYAREPGKGAFRRMIEGIQAAGLVPVVICPFSQMEAILTRWGWGSDDNEEWRPPPQEKDPDT